MGIKWTKQWKKPSAAPKIKTSVFLKWPTLQHITQLVQIVRAAGRQHQCVSFLPRECHSGHCDRLSAQTCVHFDGPCGHFCAVIHLQNQILKIHTKNSILSSIFGVAYRVGQDPRQYGIHLLRHLQQLKFLDHDLVEPIAGRHQLRRQFSIFHLVSDDLPTPHAHSYLVDDIS